MPKNSLPDVPTLNAAPAAGAERIVEAARAGAEPQVQRKKPSGWWFEKRRKLRAQGLPDPPLPPGTTLHPRRPGPGVALTSYIPTVPPPAPELPPPAPELPPPAPELPPPADPAPALKRLELADVKEETAQRASEDAAAAVAAERAELLTIGRPDLERRVGSLGALGFRLVGIVLGDEDTWALSETQRTELAALFVEAFPEECAQLVQGGNMAKIIAIGTLGNVCRQKWVTYRAKKTAAPAPAAPAATLDQRPVEAPKRFTGLPDMQSAA